jgi:hypothetical protein
MVDEHTHLGREFEKPEGFDVCRVLLVFVQLEDLGVFEKADLVPDVAGNHDGGKNEV